MSLDVKWRRNGLNVP